MPAPEIYSAEKTVSLLATAGNYAQLPGSEYIMSLAVQLKLAEAAVKQAVSDRLDLQLQLRSLKNELLSNDKRTNEAMNQMLGAENLIKRIAAGEKNPKKLAKEYLHPLPQPVSINDTTAATNP